MYYFAYVQYAGCSTKWYIFLHCKLLLKDGIRVILPFYGNFPQKTLIQKSLISAFILEWHISQWDNVVNPKSFYFWKIFYQHFLGHHVAIGCGLWNGSWQDYYSRHNFQSIFTTENVSCWSGIYPLHLYYSAPNLNEFSKISYDGTKLCWNFILGVHFWNSLNLITFLGFMDGAIFNRDHFTVPFLECL